MKRVSMWIMLCWICFAGVLKAQQEALRLDVSVENASLEQFVRLVEKESGYSLFMEKMFRYANPLRFR